MYGRKLERWASFAEWPLTAAALLFFAAYATQVIAKPSGAFDTTAEILIWVTWVVFLVDYVVRIVITENRFRWFYRNLLDLAIVALPMLRPLRLMRFLTVIALVQRGAGNILRGRIAVYTVSAATLIMLISALAILDAEQATGSIESFGDALWWAFVTMTTVGYGDYYPVTLTGRLIAAGLMIGGIALIGAVTATLASWIVEKVSLDSEAKDPTTEQVEQLRVEIAQVRELLEAARLP